MKSNYKRLGDYIVEVEERNRDGRVKLSQGICNLKYFQDPRQVAENSVNDKIVRTGWFAYNRATTRNGDKISIAYREGEDCTVSASYLTFKIKDEDQLNPHYLLMWFKRPEFDRYARFKSHGSAHEYFEWDEMCEVYLPVPSIEKQRNIVAEYQAVERRIANNRRLIAMLEATAQSIYRNLFVDNIDPENLPEGWRMGTVGDVAEINTANYNSKDKFSIIHYLDTSSVTENIFTEYQTLYPQKDEIPSRAKRKVQNRDIVYSTVRPNLKHYGIIRGNTDTVLVSTGFAVIRSKCNALSNELLFLVITNKDNTDYLQHIAEMSKATYPSITADDILALPTLIPSESDIMDSFNNSIRSCYDYIYFLREEISRLSSLNNLLLSKLAR